MKLDEAKEILNKAGFILESSSFDKMNDKDLIINYFAHWTGYKSGGKVTGSGKENPAAGKIADILFDRLGNRWLKIDDRLSIAINKILDKFHPIDGVPTDEDIRIQAVEGWPLVLNYLNKNLDKILDGASGKPIKKTFYNNGVIISK
jgi:hypothetical protein